MRKIKVWTGTHPDERRALKAGNSLRNNPIQGVDTGIVNLDAYRLDKRQVDINMIKAYPGDPNSKISEERRAPQVLKESQGYYAVIDLHDIYGYGEDTAYIGTFGVSHQALGFLAHIGIKKLVRTSYNSLHEHLDNCFLLELSAASHRSEVEFLRGAFRYLANAKQLPTARANEFEWFEFLDNIPKERMLPDQLPSNIRGFDRVSDSIASQMGHPNKAVHMLNWRETPNESGYWAEIGTPINPPDDTNWPLPVATTAPLPAPLDIKTTSV